MIVKIDIHKDRTAVLQLEALGFENRLAMRPKSDYTNCVCVALDHNKFYWSGSMDSITGFPVINMDELCMLLLLPSGDVRQKLAFELCHMRKNTGEQS